MIDVTTMNILNSFGQEENEVREYLYCSDEFITHISSKYLTVYERKEFTMKGRYKLKSKVGEDYKSVKSIC